MSPVDPTIYSLGNIYSVEKAVSDDSMLVIQKTSSL